MEEEKEDPKKNRKGDKQTREDQFKNITNP